MVSSIPMKGQPTKKSSDESDDSSDKQTAKEKVANQSVNSSATVKQQVIKKAKDSSDDSDDSSDDEKPSMKIAEKKVAPNLNKTGHSSDDSDSDDDMEQPPAKKIAQDDSSEEDMKPQAVGTSSKNTTKTTNTTNTVSALPNKKPVKKEMSSSSSDDDDSDSEDSNDGPPTKTPIVKNNAKLSSKAIKANKDSPSDDNEEKEKKMEMPKQQTNQSKPGQKRKFEQTNGTPNNQQFKKKYSNFVKAEETKKPGFTSTPLNNNSNKKNKNKKSKLFNQSMNDKNGIDFADGVGGGKKRKNEPFRRVRDEDVEIDERVKDMSFEAKKNAVGSWGDKAYRDLKYTRGKSFKHEKTKKKRGSYRGGQIDTSVNSIKFED